MFKSTTKLEMPLKLYKLDISPPVCATLMLIEHLKVSPIELVDVDLINKEHLKPEYLEVGTEIRLKNLPI